MKKIYLYATLLITACFFACNDEDFNAGIAPPQSYPQKEVQTTDGFTFALGDVASSGIVINEEDLANKVLYEVIKTTATPAMDENATVQFKLEISNTENFAKKTELPCTNDANAATVSAADLEAAVKEIYGRGKDPRSVYLRAHYYLVDGTSSVLMPNPVVLGPFTATLLAGPDLYPYYEITPKPYFIIGYGGWDNSFAGLGTSLIPLSCVAGNVYDQNGAGTFSYTGYFEASKEFKLVGIIGNWDEQWGSSDNGLTPVYKDGGSKNFKVPVDGYYTITLNSIDNVLKIEPSTLTPTLYTSMGLIGDINNWGADEAMLPYQDVENHVWYTTYTFEADAVADGGVKIRADGSWSVSWGGNYFPYCIGTSENGANISYKAGTYTLIFNDVDGMYYFFQ